MRKSEHTEMYLKGKGAVKMNGKDAIRCRVRRKCPRAQRRQRRRNVS
jgi:hypothetical protein